MTIKLTIKGQEVELTPEEASEIFFKLKEMTFPCSSCDCINIPVRPALLGEIKIDSSTPKC